MQTELPGCTRCCFCLPLRYGLIAWGYTRIAISILFFISLSAAFYGLLGMALHDDSSEYTIYAVLTGFVLVVVLTDIALNITFVVGGHKKNPKLLRTYYIYSFVICVLTSLIGIASSIYTLFLFKLEEVDLVFHIWVFLADATTMLAQIFIQIYVLLLVRSEMIKLRSNCEFRFVNHAAEAECNMKCGENGEECKEEGIEYKYERHVPDMYTC